jgi:hypothetical protein
LTVVEIERPRRGERRRGKSDPIDAHLAALHALHLDADRLPTPRADREALPILLRAHRELTTAKTRTINRLRALLLTGSDADRALSRGGQHQTPKHAIRRAEARRLALAISGIDRDLGDNKCHLAELVTIVACDGHGPSVHQVLALGHRWVPEPGLRRLARAAARPEETAIVDDSDLRSLVIPWSVATGSSAMTQASCPGHRGSLSISCLDFGAVRHADA